MPAPTSPSFGACSYSSTLWPAFIRHEAAVSPPKPAPAIKILYAMEYSERFVVAQGGHHLLAEQPDRAHQIGLRQIGEIELSEEDVEQALLRSLAQFPGHGLGRTDKDDI